MIQVFEPFRSKIKLHIGEAFLQELWDRYVPVSSDTYEKISLIYLNGGDRQEAEPAQPAQQAANLAVKNIIIWMDLRQNPILLSSQAINQSIRNSTLYCLEQLKRSDYNTYRFLEKQVFRLEQEEQDDRRYQEWERETKAIEIWRQEYRLLEQISWRIQEKSGEHSVKQEQEIGEEIIRQVLDELQPAEREFAESNTEICRILKSPGDINLNVSGRLRELRETIRNRAERSFGKYYDILREADIGFPGGSQSEDGTEWQMPDVGETGEFGTAETENATQSIYERELREWGAELLVYAGYGDGQEEDTVLREMRGDQALQPVEVPGQTLRTSGSKQPGQGDQERKRVHKDDTARTDKVTQEKMRRLLRSMEEQVSRRIGVRMEPEDFRLTYGDSILQNRTIWRMMDYVGTLDAEKYQRFVRELSESVFLQWQEHQGSRITFKSETRPYSEKTLQMIRIDTSADSPYAGQEEAETREVETTETKNAAQSIYEKELREWSAELLVYAGYGDGQESHEDEIGQSGQTAQIRQKTQIDGPAYTTRMEEIKQTAQADGATQTDETVQISYAEQEKVRRLLRSMEEQVGRRISVRMEQEGFRLTYGDSILQNRTIRRMMDYAGTLDAEKYQRFVRELSESVFLQWQEHQGSRVTVKDEIRPYREKTLQPGQRYPDKGENAPEYTLGTRAGILPEGNKEGTRRTEETESAGRGNEAESVRENEFRQWGRALLVYAGYGDGQEAHEDEIEQSGQTAQIRQKTQIDGPAYTIRMEETKQTARADGATQTDEAVQRSQAEQEKVRSLLRSMGEQVGRRISVRTGQEDFRLTYGDSVLQNRTIRRMMEHVGTLDAEEYQRFVRELSESVFLQWQEYQGSCVTVKDETRPYSEKMLQPGQRYPDKGENALEYTPGTGARILSEENKEGIRRTEETESAGRGNESESVRENEFREWGRVLLVYAGYGDGQEAYEDEIGQSGQTAQIRQETQIAESAYIIRMEETDQTARTDRAIQTDEAVQTSQAEQKKMRSLLRSMEEQVGRRISVRTGQKDFRLIYGDSVLQNRTIRRMMEHVGTLDAEEYTRFVRELSESVFLQWQECQESRIIVEDENRSYSEKALQPGLQYTGKGENYSENTSGTGEGILSAENKDGFRRTEETERDGAGNAAERIQENEFQEWGRALLVYAGYRNAREDDTASRDVRKGDTASGDIREGGTAYSGKGTDAAISGDGRHIIAESGEYVSAELILREKRDSAEQDGKKPVGSQKMSAGQVLQPADIRGQIELGKIRGRLRSMEEQISRQISVRTGRDDFYLSYENGILQDRTIRKLVERIGTLEAEEYPQFVRRLSESVYRQWQEQQNARSQRMMDSPAQTESRIQNQEYVQPQRTANPDGEMRTNLVYTDIPEERVRTEREYISARDRVLSYEKERRARTGEWAYRFRAAYEADGIRQTEKYGAGFLYDGDSGRTVRQMIRTVSGEKRNLAANSAHPGIIEITNDTEALLTLNQSDTAGTSPYGEREESPRVYTDNTAMQSILTQTRIRVQEETRERKTVQEQINNRLNELEQQLSRKIKQTGATENAAALAEQVKRQLHEELHMEKLRRGLS